MDIGPRIEPAGGSRITEELRNLPPEFDNFEDALTHVQTGNRFASESVMRRRLAGQSHELPNGKIGWKFDPAIREQRINGTAAPAADLWPTLERITCPTLLVRGTGNRPAYRGNGPADGGHAGAGNAGRDPARRAYGVRRQPHRLHRRGEGVAGRLVGSAIAVCRRARKV